MRFASRSGHFKGTNFRKDDMKYDGFTKYDANVAQNYERDRIGEPHWQAEQAFVARFTAEANLGTVLDLPVGTGRFFEYYGGADSVVGIDISKHMLAQARDKASALGATRIELKEGDALSLPCADSSFDTVFCFRLVHLMPPELVPGVFVELARVTRGHILMQVYASPERATQGSVRRGLARLRSLVVPQQRRQEAKPWSHIQSYPHTAGFLLGCAEQAGLRLLHRHVIAEYQGVSVDVLDLTK